MRSTFKAALLLASIAFTWSASAFSVSPMVAEFDPNAARSQQVFVLTNPTDTEKPIEVSVIKPSYDENMVESMEEGVGEDLFLIIPQQFVLPPNSRRSVKIFYVGEPMEEEDTYRFLFKELPVELEGPEDLPDGESTFSMSVVMQYYTRIWLTPSHLDEKLEITSFERIEMDAPAQQQREDLTNDTEADQTPIEKVPMLRFTVANTGLKHGYLRYPTFDILTRNGKKLTLSNESIEHVAGQVIFKQSEKTFNVRWENSFPSLDEISEIRLKTEKL